MEAFSTIDAAIAGGEAPSVDVPAELRDAAEALERAKNAAIYTVMKAAMRYMMNMDAEQEFLGQAADGLINLFAMDSAIARAADAVRAERPDANLHALAARLAVWRYLPGVRENLTEMIENAAADGASAERDEDLARVRAYLGDYHFASTPALHEMAAAVIARGGYPLGV
jgi:hypothetical protein